MDDGARRMWLRAVLGSLLAFVLVVVFNLTALEQSLPGALAFPAVFTLIMLVAKGRYIRDHTGPGK